MADYTNLVHGPGTVYINTTVAAALPADTTAKGGSWGGTWVELGYTGGVSLAISDERTHIEVDQSTADVKSFVTKQEASVTVSMKEATMANLKYALGLGTLSTTGSTEVLQVGDNPILTEYSIGIEGQSPNTSAAFRRAQIYRVVGEPSIEHVFSRSEETIIQATWRMLLHTSGTAGNNLWQIRDYIA